MVSSYVTFKQITDLRRNLGTSDCEWYILRQAHCPDGDNLGISYCEMFVFNARVLSIALSHLVCEYLDALSFEPNAFVPSRCVGI